MAQALKANKMFNSDLVARITDTHSHRAAVADVDDHPAPGWASAGGVVGGDLF